MTDSDLSRRIRSFVIRTGRMTDSQKAGWDIGFPKHGFTLSDNQFDWNSSFDGVGPRVLEIGFGMGDS
ncbi:MAG: tRNA (guanosine(46)-N7)-methyltransferase TrmB, partial [Pseudomonadota bacterium]|nr:tRNA (guanosine(46)-N7)-methyltransferase TrmB [Pseudomonadota bacterium]